MVQSWTLIDTEAYPSSPDGPWDAAETGGFQLTRRRLHGGLCDGVETMEIGNGRLQLIVLPTRGMGIWKATCDGIPLGWRSPVSGPVHPAFVPLAEPTGVGWLNGFDELLVRCGLESNGAPEFAPDGRLIYPLHGKIANRPAHRVTLEIDDEAGELVLTGVVDESRLMCAKLRLTSRIRLPRDGCACWIEDRVENLSAEPSSCQMLYHTNIGMPWLEAGAFFVAPVKTVVPRNSHSAQGMADWNQFLGPRAGFQEQAYFMELVAGTDQQSTVLLRNRTGTQGVSLAIRTDTLPCFTLWKYTAAPEDGYVMGLEPGTNFPNPRSFEERHGRVVPLPPRASVEFAFGLRAHSTADDVAAVEASIADLQSMVEPQSLPLPSATWCADR